MVKSDTEYREGQPPQHMENTRQDQNFMTAETLEKVFDPKHLEFSRLVNWLDSTSKGEFFTNLKACAAAAEILSVGNHMFTGGSAVQPQLSVMPMRALQAEYR